MSYTRIQFCDECDDDTHHEGHPHPFNPKFIVLMECVECGAVNEHIELNQE